MDMPYQPGDSFDVLSPNDATEVLKLLQMLRLEQQSHHCVQLELRKDTKKKGDSASAKLKANWYKFTLYTLSRMLLVYGLFKKAMKKKAYCSTLAILHT